MAAVVSIEYKVLISNEDGFSPLFNIFRNFLKSNNDELTVKQNF